MDEYNIERLLKETFVNKYRTDFINVNGYCFPKYYRKFANDIENMEVRNDDIWVCSFPKTGTTWTQEMVWCLANNLDFEAAKKPLNRRFPLLEASILFNFEKIKKHMNMEIPLQLTDSINCVEKLTSPRYIKTHLPFSLLPRQLRSGEKKPKMIYVTRNPKDTCISYYYHCKLIDGYNGNFNEFCSLFLAGKVCWAPFWDNVLDYWKIRDQANIIFIQYETMKADLSSVIIKVADFLGKKINNTEIKTLENHLSFANMKKNPSVNHENLIELFKKFTLTTTVDGKFIRCGKTNQ